MWRLVLALLSAEGGALGRTGSGSPVHIAARPLKPRSQHDRLCGVLGRSVGICAPRGVVTGEPLSLLRAPRWTMRLSQ